MSVSISKKLVYVAPEVLVMEVKPDQLFLVNESSVPDALGARDLFDNSDKLDPVAKKTDVFN